MTQNPGKAIVLVSGGLDSCVATTWAVRERGYACIPINFAYGQRHAREIVGSEQICEALGLPAPITFNLTQAFTLIGGSSLTSGRRDTNPSTEEVSRTPSALPPSFVPGRNIIMLAVAASLGYTLEAETIIGGWNAVDYSGYPDCRQAFFDAMAQALDQGLGFADTPLEVVDIQAPLVNLTKEEIVKLGVRLNAPMQYSWSCYAGGSTPCGECDSCKIRIDGFAKAGVEDPALRGGL